ncbi:MAG: hypothetical protein V5A79_06645, partial [Candidatus Bipolaricaulota bacterium]
MSMKRSSIILAVFLLTGALFLAGVAPVAMAEDGEVRIAVLQPRPQKGLYFYGTWAIQGFKIGLQYATNAP